LQCAAGALSAKEGNFCYPIPSGFDDVSTTAEYTTDDSERTAIEPTDSSDRDLITVTSSTLSANEHSYDSFSDDRLRTLLQNAFKRPSEGKASASPVEQSTVAGHRAFETTVTYDDGAQKRLLFIYAARLQVVVSCQGLDQKSAVEDACDEVLTSLQIRNQ